MGMAMASTSRLLTSLGCGCGLQYPFVLLLAAGPEIAEKAREEPERHDNNRAKQQDSRSTFLTVSRLNEDIQFQSLTTALKRLAGSNPKSVNTTPIMTEAIASCKMTAAGLPPKKRSMVMLRP